MTVGEEHDRRAGLTVWAQNARVRSATYAAQAVRAAEAATVIRQQVDCIIERLAQRNPDYAEHLRAIVATAVSRRSAIADARNNRNDNGQLLSGPWRQPGPADATEQQGQPGDGAIVRDRDRAVGELYDQVIQRVFAAGLILQDAADLTVEPEARWRIEAVADELDGLIQVIRGPAFNPAD